MNAAIVRFFGPQVQDRVQEYITEESLDEQPVGTSFSVETGHPKHPFLAHIPTMRLPMTIARTDYPNLAMWALLLAVRRHNREHSSQIATVACPGFGTGVGRMPYEEASRRMAVAYDSYLYPPIHQRHGRY